MYDWMAGLTDEEEDHVMKTQSKLRPIAELDMGNIPDLAKCYKVKALGKASEMKQLVRVVTLIEDQQEVYPTHFYVTKEGSVDVNEEPNREQPNREQVKGYTILGWNLTLEKQVIHINLGSSKAPKLVKINSKANNEFLKGVEALLHKYKDMFTWSYRNTKGIPPSIREH